MPSRAGEVSSRQPLSTWLLAGAAVLVTLALGYLISLDLPWLHLAFDATRIDHLFFLFVGALAALAVLKWPEIGLFVLMAALYTNVSELGVRFHGLPSMLQLLIPVLLIALIGRQLISQGQRLVWDPLLAWLVIYGAVIFASSARAVNPYLADVRLAQYAKSLLMLLLFINLLRSPRTLRRAVWVLVLIGAFLGTISVYQVLTSSYGFEFWGFGRVKLAHIVGRLHQPRITGPLSDPNFYAQVLVVLAPVALYRLWDEASLRLKALAGYGLAVVILALVFTYSRGGALALGLILFLAAIQKKVKLQHLCLGLLIVVPVLVVAPRQFEGRLGTLKQLLPGGRESVIHVDTSIRERTLLMQAAWEMFVQHPFLGVGAGNYPEHYPEYADRIGSTVSSFEDFGRERFPHSLYLQVAAETGLVGLVVFAAIIWSTLVAFRSAAKRFAAARDLRSANVVISLALGFIGFLTSSLILHGDYMQYFWLLVAIAVAAQHIAHQPQGAQIAVSRFAPCPS